MTRKNLCQREEPHLSFGSGLCFKKKTEGKEHASQFSMPLLWPVVGTVPTRFITSEQNQLEDQGGL